MRVAVIGSGSWGTALAMLAGQIGHQVRLWAFEAEVVATIRATRENSLFLPGFRIPDTVVPSHALSEVLTDAEIVMLVMPSHVCRSLLTEIVPHAHERMIFVSATKGLEADTHLRMDEVIRAVMKDHFEPRLVVLSGPSFAAEVARGDPTAVVAASEMEEDRLLVQESFSSGAFRIYTSPDVIGVGIGGSVKNVMAIAAGVVAGLGWGYNTAAALITRGVAEMTRLAVAAGGRPESMAGLAGMGDLVLTCMGALSRNRRVGVELGKGRRLEDILAETNTVAEGVNTTRATRGLGQKLGIELPITEGVYDMLYERKSPRAAAAELMLRPLRDER
ncbi:MAG: NAD(P)-dependent glycerol-3-phosphate dehydrogenase [Acidobacteria bacterium]|nr:NAD(P)-dependent glycerol-3-phosphate dehydrogenase [Acidobacteriota bacterium]